MKFRRSSLSWRLPTAFASLEYETWEESKLNGVEGTWFAISKND
jgi:hypothetical protein